MNDEKLYTLCKRYSKFIRYGRQKFIGLLPEVYKSRMFERKGFGTIYEFAAKLAYMSREQVDLVLNLNKRFEDKPALQSLLLNGEASVNKLARVVSIATAENQEVIAAQVKILPQKALETLVRDEKSAAKINDEYGLQEPLLDCKSLRAQTILSKLRIDAELVEKIYELQAKGIDINDMIRKMLENREAGIATAKNAEGEKALANGVEGKIQVAGEDVRTKDGGRMRSRYISVKVRKILREDHGDKCSMPACRKPARQIHHTQRFALAGVHDPRYMAPLCVEHHKIAHSIDQKTREKWWNGS